MSGSSENPALYTIVELGLLAFYRALNPTAQRRTLETLIDCRGRDASKFDDECMAGAAGEVILLRYYRDLTPAMRTSFITALEHVALELPREVMSAELQPA